MKAQSMILKLDLVGTLCQHTDSVIPESSLENCRNRVMFLHFEWSGHQSQALTRPLLASLLLCTGPSFTVLAFLLLCTRLCFA